ncbi:hypothetical protein EVAR_13452_1 [Eumeta japonica]|uniref:Uncharacterized protein n=1 Tax=Eumeta variegata TaxID=151549 RepID=A0A4C1UXV5_EUMVA|nr:hypothetical protein EVAR_13452_1 [Eumeta japonica]
MRLKSEPRARPKSGLRFVVRLGARIALDQLQKKEEYTLWLNGLPNKMRTMEKCQPDNRDYIIIRVQARHTMDVFASLEFRRMPPCRGTLERRPIKGKVGCVYESGNI